MYTYTIAPGFELQLLEQRHAEELFAVIEANRAHLGRFLTWVEAMPTAEGARQYIRQSLYRFSEDGSFLAGIRLQGKLVGTIDLINTNTRSRHVEIGYWLAETAQGQGLVTRACAALLGHVFTAWQFNRVEIHANPANRRSCAVAERLGFQREGVLRQLVWTRDHYTDRAYYALLREEWTGTGERIAFSRPLLPETEIRLLEGRDAEALFALADANRAHLRPWITWIDGTTAVEHSRSFIRYATQQFAEGREIHWSLWHRGELAGMIGTLPIKWADREVEIGYWLGEAFQGKGIVTTAARALITHLFTVCGLNRVVIRLRAGNARSRGVAERLGFAYEGLQRQTAWVEGQLVDVECYALLCEHWEETTCP